MKMPDLLHLVALALAGMNLLFVPLWLWVRYPRMRARLPHARRICLAYAVGFDLPNVVFIVGAIQPSVSPQVGDVLVAVALLCVPASALILAYGGYWHQVDSNGWCW